MKLNTIPDIHSTMPQINAILDIEPLGKAKATNMEIIQHVTWFISANNRREADFTTAHPVIPETGKRNHRGGLHFAIKLYT